MSSERATDDVRYIRVQCPRLLCLQILAVPETVRGDLIRCRGCGTVIRVPRTRAAA